MGNYLFHNRILHPTNGFTYNIRDSSRYQGTGCEIQFKNILIWTKGPHCLEQKVELKENLTEGKCVQIPMFPLCSRCGDLVQSLFCSWGAKVASQGRTVIPNCYHRCGGLVPPGGRFWECWAQVPGLVLRLCHQWGFSQKSREG